MKYALAIKNRTYSSIAKSLKTDECLVYLDTLSGKIYLDLIYAHEERDLSWYLLHKYEVNHLPINNDNSKVLEQICYALITGPIPICITTGPMPICITKEERWNYSSSSFSIDIQDIHHLPDDLFMLIITNLQLLK